MISHLERDQIPNPPRAIKPPAEATLRVNNLQRIIRFYRDALGFELIGDFPNAALLEITGADRGGTLAIGLFKTMAGLQPEHPAVDRITISIPLEDWWHKRRRLEHLGFPVEAVDSNRIFTRDPEGNQVEMICHNDITGSDLGFD